MRIRNNVDLYFDGQMAPVVSHRLQAYS